MVVVTNPVVGFKTTLGSEAGVTTEMIEFAVVAGCPSVISLDRTLIGFIGEPTTPLALSGAGVTDPDGV